MITTEMQAYAKGYEAARGDEIIACIQSLHTRAKTLSGAFPELAEGIRVAADILQETYDKRSAREPKRSKKKPHTSLI
jgi:hypothetical protein